MLSSSKINLRLEEIAQTKNLSLQQISEASGIPIEIIQSHSREAFDITEDTCNSLRKISKVLGEPVLDLIQPRFKKEAFKLSILELCKQKNISFNELAKRSGIHPSILGFYSTQIINSQKLNEQNFQKDLKKINQVLGSSNEELKSEAELPKTKIQIDEWANERGLTLEDLSSLTGLPYEFIDLVNTTPINISNLIENQDLKSLDLDEIMAPVREFVCAICRCCPQR